MYQFLKLLKRLTGLKLDNEEQTHANEWKQVVHRAKKRSK